VSWTGWDRLYTLRSKVESLLDFSAAQELV